MANFKLDEGSREIPSIDNFKPLDKSIEKSLIAFMKLQLKQLNLN